MISELLGEALGIHDNGERSKHSNIINGVLGMGSTSSCISSPSVSPALSPSPSPTSSTVATSSATTTSGGGAENLRCPRCDSTNTKFCYYNNYNLTQPRHFCKTCRRYWTKGGALRNVPIGGGCRKNRTAIVASSAVLKSAATVSKFRAMATEIGKSTLMMSNFDHEYPTPTSASSNPNPILWTSTEHNSHVLSLLRVNQNPNPSSGPLSSTPLAAVRVKQESSSVPGSSQQHNPVFASGPVPNARILPGLDASFGIKTGSFWRENDRQNIGFLVGEAQGNGDLYQRLKSSSSASASYNNGSVQSLNQGIVLGSNINVSSGSSSSLTNILDSAPVAAVAADQLGSCWNNPILSWSDLPTTHGAYPSIN